MRYGLPYKGSKNRIARDIISFLPPGESLVDLFAGGCAITHAALEACDGIAPKWNEIICNDIDPLAISLFRDCIDGKYTVENHKQWISREDFHRMKDSNAWVRYCWSFGNNGLNYMYSREIEPWKRALHGAYVLNDYTLLEEIVGTIPGEHKSDLAAWIKANEDVLKEKYIAWYRGAYLKGIKTECVPEAVETESALAKLKEELKQYLRNALKESGLRAIDVNRHLGTNGMAGHYFGDSQWEFPTIEAYEKLKEILPLDRAYPFHLALLQRLQGLQGLQGLQRLQSLQSLQSLQRLQGLEGLQGADKVEYSVKDYRGVEIPSNAVIYCDIPYQRTDCGCYEGFDSEAFFNWAANQEARIYISSYRIDDVRFQCVWEKPKRNKCMGGGGKLVTERIYTQTGR